jgi:hypothetical protein
MEIGTIIIAALILFISWAFLNKAEIPVINIVKNISFVDNAP